jgi:hypothetical protein
VVGQRGSAARREAQQAGAQVTQRNSLWRRGAAALLFGTLAIGARAHEMTPERRAAINMNCKAWAYKRIPVTAPEAEGRGNAQIIQDRDELYHECLVKYGLTQPEQPKAPSP